jgi:hypothetical protein
MSRTSVGIVLLTTVVCSLAVPASAQTTSVGIDCSQIRSLRLLEQENLRAGAALIECGITPGGRRTVRREAEAPAPPNVLVSNRDCANSSSCTKSESAVWASPDGQTIVVNYNDHQNSQFSGVSYSTDSGATFTEIEPPPFATGHGSNFGDPVVVYNQKLHMWYAGDLVTQCGGFGIGLWTSPDGINWTPGGCAFSGGNTDRESMWVDNDPTSAGYGRMYVSFNNFVKSGALEVSYSDDGITWNVVQLSTTFIRDVQITGAQISPTPHRASLRGYNSVFVAGMDEGGGGPATRQNLIWRSDNGGASWNQVVMGPRFNPVGDSTCGYFQQINPIWRHQGWGEPAVGPNNVVHYVFAGAGTGGDNGDIYYTRSTDNGATWSTPIKLNTDPDQQYHTQWMPSLSINAAGKLTASWYDRRSVSTACNNVTDVGCNYERYARQSPDNGMTWGADFALSSSIIPQPGQNDGNVSFCYAGDYDYATAHGNNAYVTWTDGRRNVGGSQVQDVNFAAVPEQ